MAADVSSNNLRQHSGYLSCAKSIHSKSGMRGFYNGFGVSLTGVVVFKAFFLGGYDIAKALFSVDANKINNGTTLGTRFLLAQVTKITYTNIDFRNII